jgi:polyhydroxyalkanoate synthase
MATALATHGQSLIDGFNNLVSDMQSGRISMTDYKQFEVGKTIAVTPGQVVLRNRLIELIQYKPQTEQVQAIPLLICPPWINRYYILDLQPHNSLVNYLVGQGYQVFMISWKNPDASYRDVTFDDYLKDGFMPALQAVKDITGEEKVNTLGYCIGGAMLACATALLNTKKDDSINSAAFLTTLTDYSQTGDLGVFIDEEQVSALEAKMNKEGVLDGRDMAGTFASLRASDLIWSYVINNYMLGKQPAPFDILYWNDDSTRMPCAMHSWYLRNFYLENNIATPGKLALMDTKLDITNLTQPLYMLSGQADHITPWMTCYKPFARMKSASKRFILSKSGHVAGVVNPPTPAGKPIKKTLFAGSADSATGDAWLKTVGEVPDSWWPDYAQWLKPLSGNSVPAPKAQGNKAYKPLEAAPGQYVKEK